MGEGVAELLLKSTIISNVFRALNKRECRLGGRSSADGLVVRDVFLQLYMLLPVSQEVSDLSAGWESLFCKRTGMMVLGSITEIHKEDPCIGSLRVQVLEDEMKYHVEIIVYKSVCELQGVQRQVSDGFKVVKHKVLKGLTPNNHRSEGNRSL